VAPPPNPTEVDTISVGFFFTLKRKKRPNWGVFEHEFFFLNYPSFFERLKIIFRRFFAQKLEPPRESVSEYRTYKIVAIFPSELYYFLLVEKDRSVIDIKMHQRLLNMQCSSLRVL